ncbi:MAG: hypothetical protein COU11_02275 [Candidatus Harrisonbacteria bacterium CG10_big_fil_rev_8_21_14_0_10_49_15]|uniref:Uncharacterized protein n=1 Tax=Candidatus Harrisonbacteria bacterium CG10_big_fil_rev_8_21_14_0_10_49_15 TaxID=1974587 RepID=A0A2H0UKU4_9BACT|nr:MAG: hypothetical protein COU11_02275 [Candidatus Harrisonbacteria bacterium CG10_big_fil_rev_8_21_14_0_10_49_15]
MAQGTQMRAHPLVPRRAQTFASQPLWWPRAVFGPGEIKAEVGVGLWKTRISGIRWKNGGLF